LAYKPITELAHLIRTRHLSPGALTDLYLERIGQYNGALKSYITVVPERARREAHEAARALQQGVDVGSLHGIPLASKDEFSTTGVRTTCSSLRLSECVPDDDATTVATRHEAGAVMLGTLHMTAWATPLTLALPYGQPCHPWNVEHAAGGSSTGSGRAPAAALCAGAVGEDPGGSSRRPAAHTRCVGLRPSWGRGSLSGVIPAVWAQDTAGPLTRPVADWAFVMNGIAGYAPHALLSARLPGPDDTAGLDGAIRGMRVGVVKETLEAGPRHPEGKAAVAEALRRFDGLGATVEEVSLPTIPLSGVVSGAGGSDRPALQWKPLRHSADHDAAARRFHLRPGLLPGALSQRARQLPLRR
jgi:Asp-tRNA(Asn)/Glu-tRNA(Gln) amidotransferase A subunit family amidase